MNIKHGPYSPSRLETATCPYLFKKTYIEKDPRTRTQSIAASRGSAVHEVFEKMTADMINNDKGVVFTKQQLQGYVKDAINQNPEAYPEVKDVLEMAIKYARTPPKMLTDDAELEVRFAVKLDGDSFVECGYDDPVAVARGRADIQMISDDLKTAYIYDHKTQPNIEDADTFQLGFYAWVMFRSNPFLQKIKTVLHFARYGMYSEPYEWSREDLDVIEDEVVTRIGIIESKEVWDAVPYKNCQYCPLLSECPIMKEIIKTDAQGRPVIDPRSHAILGNTSQAVKVAGYINVLDELKKNLTADLREHVKKANCGIAIPGKVYEYRPDNGVDWGKANKTMKKDLCAIFKKHGIDEITYMSFNQTASGGVWKLGNKKLLEELVAVLPRKLTTTFRGYKA